MHVTACYDADLGWYCEVWHMGEKVHITFAHPFEHLAQGEAASWLCHQDAQALLQTVRV